jgi:hypothetical protein
MTNESRATAAVIEFVTQSKIDHFPREAVALAKQCVADGLGVILAGSTRKEAASFDSLSGRARKRPAAWWPDYYERTADVQGAAITPGAQATG